jgi:hypothetical protein
LRREGTQGHRPEDLEALARIGECLLEVSAPGVYEVSFEGVGADRFLPILPRLVTARSGETAEVIVELRRK